MDRLFVVHIHSVVKSLQTGSDLEAVRNVNLSKLESSAIDVALVSETDDSESEGDKEDSDDDR